MGRMVLCSDLGRCLHDQHGTDNTDGGKTGSLHAHASGAALAVAASSVGRSGGCVSGCGRACSASGGEDGAVVGGVDAVASSARGSARDAACESRSAGDGHGGVGVGGVAAGGGSKAAGCGGGLGARLGGAGRGGVGGCGWEVSIEYGQCVARSVQSSNVQMVSPASSQTSLKYLEAASSCSPQFLEM